MMTHLGKTDKTTLGRLIAGAGVVSVAEYLQLAPNTVVRALTELPVRKSTARRVSKGLRDLRRAALERNEQHAIAPAHA